ncbi:MAG: choice-of-anchor D domain-containing protein [Betaproteobacteria bacterium]|nr:choice-of-anchor D domain-containing protein [Betaproteobacteria bacterium]
MMSSPDRMTEIEPQPSLRITRRRARAWQAALIRLAVLAAGPALAADPERGARLFATPPLPGLLACADCHSDNPLTNNFGNIWSGRNAPTLIERAVSLNTGGMAVFQGLYGRLDLSDIAAFLGNAPRRLDFPLTPLGAGSIAQRMTVSSSTKTALNQLAFSTEGDFAIVATSCGTTLPRFAVCAIDLTFRPTHPGAHQGSLYIAHADSPSPVRIPLTGQAPDLPPAVARLAPTAIDFGSTVAGHDGATHIATLEHDSGSPLRLGAVEVEGGDFVHAGGSCIPGLVLKARERCHIALRFAPQAAGERRGRLVVRHDAQTGAQGVDLRGQAALGPAPRLLADPPWLDFGAMPQPMTSVPLTLTLRNVGDAMARLQTLRSTTAEFQIEHSDCVPGRLLAPRQACRVQLALRATRVAAYSAGLEFGVEGLPLQRVALAGRVGAVRSPPPTQADSDPNAPRLLIDAAHIDFGEVPLDGSVPEHTVTVRHIGPGLLEWGTVALAGAAAGRFVISGTCSPLASLASGEACTLRIGVRPGVTGLHTATLVLWPASAATAVELPLRARAVESPTPASPAEPDAASATLVWSPPAPAGGDSVPVGSTAPLGAWVLRNTSAAESSPLAWALAGMHERDFEVDASSSCRHGQPLPVGGQCTLALRFRPSGAGMRQASLGLVAGKQRAPPISLQGRGAAAAAARVRWEPGDLNFIVPPDGAAPAAQPLWLHNDGAYTLRLALQPPGAVGITLSASLSSEGCDLAAPALQPGMRCSIDLHWNRDPRLASPATIAVGGDAQAMATLAATEDPARLSNQGRGGGAPGSPIAWIALAAAAWALRCTRTRQQRESSNDRADEPPCDVGSRR